MDDAFSPDSLALGPNLSSSPWNSNLSFPSLWATPGQPVRTVSVAVILLLGLAGNGLLLHRLRCGGCCCAGRFARRRKMDFFLAHLAVADLYGCGLALLSQLPPAADAGQAEWPAGDTTCRLFRLLQGSGLLAPSHMLVLLALERHHMVSGARDPPQPLPAFMPARGALATLGWLLALLLALPQAFVYRLAPPHDGSHCLSVFAQRPPWHGRAYAVYGLLASFVAPACLLGGTCGRILRALSASRAKEEEPSRAAPGSSRRHRVELPGVAASPPPPLLLRLLPAGKCAPPSPRAPRSLPRARARALQLTLALTTLFAFCGFPRFVLELGLAFAFPASAAEEARTTLGSIMTATNCALNPYVCLIFHSHRPWARRLQSSLCRCPDGQPRRRVPHRHRPPPPPELAAERTGRWFCPCQTKPPTASAVVQQREVEAPAAAAFESGL
ncbi:probable G-protein coupled receptor 150 [Sphaerodactylus townsendi]|uniref:probable G-protein coupled receptor 150 n=1 Tax=Sphaerodactylus townsendi TaxID=933632 RepID=UPI002025FB0F|nr:probable G-protein coupled receptor 150 [Sphaerodactylus townsendi]